MGLEDKFYPEDGTLLTRFDNAMIKAAGKIGEAYQHVTGKEAKQLIRHSYGASAVFGLGIATYPHSGSIFLGLIASGYGFWKRKKFRQQSPLEERLESEAKGLNPRYWSVGRTIGAVIVMPLVSTATLLCGYAYNAKSTGENARILGSFASMTMTMATDLFADYLSKANIPKPPKKTVWARAKDKIYGLLTPQRLPQPVTASYATTDTLLSPQ